MIDLNNYPTNAESIAADLFTANQEMWHRAANQTYVNQRKVNPIVASHPDSDVGPVESAILWQMDCELSEAA